MKKFPTLATEFKACLSPDGRSYVLLLVKPGLVTESVTFPVASHFAALDWLIGQGLDQVEAGSILDGTFLTLFRHVAAHQPARASA